MITMTIINLVFVKHDGCSKQFLFQAPLDASLHMGQRVYVDTKNGECEATVSRENFFVNKGTARTITEGCGGYWPLKCVLGRMQDNIKIERKKVAFATDEIPF
jgi:hypothetical protein